MKYRKSTHRPHPRDSALHSQYADDNSWWCSHPECDGEAPGDAYRPVYLLEDKATGYDSIGTCQRHATPALWAKIQAALGT